MDFNALGQGFFQIYELEHRDVQINVRTILVKAVLGYGYYHLSRLKLFFHLLMHSFFQIIEFFTRKIFPRHTAQKFKVNIE